MLLTSSPRILSPIPSPPSSSPFRSRAKQSDRSRPSSKILRAPGPSALQAAPLGGRGRKQPPSPHPNFPHSGQNNGFLPGKRSSAEAGRAPQTKRDLAGDRQVRRREALPSSSLGTCPSLVDPRRHPCPQPSKTKRARDPRPGREAEPAVNNARPASWHRPHALIGPLRNRAARGGGWRAGARGVRWRCACAGRACAGRGRCFV